MHEATGMDIKQLEVSVRIIQDSLASVSLEQMRLQGMNAYLEQRLLELEQRIGGQPPPTDNTEGLPLSPPAIVRKDEWEEASKEASKETCIDTVEHSIGESLWEASIIIGLPELRPFNAGLLLLALLLNATVQIYLCLVLLTSGDFIQPDRFYDLEAPMRHWRMTHGHNAGEVDAAGRSLVSRVCGDDQSLAVALSQGSLLTEINAYLGLLPEELQPQGLGTGPLLCTMCIFLFTGLVMRELRSLAESLFAVCSVSHGPTRLEDGRLVALSPRRFAIFLVASAARAGIAVMLLYTGIFWLAATTSITDLILNAAALGFVMDFDEILFETVVPTTVHLFVQKLEPVKYRRPRASLEAVVPLAAIVITVCLSVIFLIGPNLQQMVVVKGVLCSGNTDFATTRNPANFVVSMPTVPFNDHTDINIEQRAVRELIDDPHLGEGPTYFSMYAAIPSFARAFFQRTLQEDAEAFRCADLDDDGSQQLMPYLFAAARYEIGVHTGISVAERPFRCADYATSCQESGLLRLSCPVTCGCDHPTSGLVEISPSGGCPRPCQLLRQERLTNASCVDNGLGNDRNWSSYWRTFSHMISKGRNLDETERQALDVWTDRKISEGCNNTEHDPAVRADFCNYEEDIFTLSGLSHIIGFCPATCCRGLPRSTSSPCPSAC